MHNLFKKEFAFHVVNEPGRAQFFKPPTRFQRFVGWVKRKDPKQSPLEQIFNGTFSVAIDYTKKEIMIKLEMPVIITTETFPLEEIDTFVPRWTHSAASYLGTKERIKK